MRTLQYKGTVQYNRSVTSHDVEDLELYTISSSYLGSWTSGKYLINYNLTAIILSTHWTHYGQLEVKPKAIVHLHVFLQPVKLLCYWTMIVFQMKL